MEFAAKKLPVTIMVVRDVENRCFREHVLTAENCRVLDILKWPAITEVVRVRVH